MAKLTTVSLCPANSSHHIQQLTFHLAQRIWDTLKSNQSTFLLGLCDSFLIGWMLLLLNKQLKFPASGDLPFLFKNLSNFCSGLYIYIQGVFSIKINRFLIFHMPSWVDRHPLSFITFNCCINTFLSGASKGENHLQALAQPL